MTLIYTKCADPKCPEPLLAVTWVGQLTHPTCKQTPEELQERAFVDALQRGNEKEIDKLERAMNKPAPAPSNGGVALWYSSQGWPVFPLLNLAQAEIVAKKEGDMVEKVLKRPGTKNGFKDATTDRVTIQRWWAETPDAGIGLATGVKFDVIDIDGPPGYKSISEVDKSDLPEIHGKVSTPHGEHWYIEPTGEGNRGGFLAGVDYRGTGGYVCAPPTEICGKRYSWTVKPSPAITGV